VGRAPIRETLAAALAMLLERQGGTGPVWDPFCGSGTLLLEWLALVTGTAPGARRRFAFEQWPLHDADAYARWVAERDSAPRADVGQVQVFGSDVSEAAISAARSNAQRAPWAKTTEWWAEDFRQAAERIPPGTRIVTNPPYGVRMGRGRSAQVLTAFEELLAARMDLRPVVLLCGDPDYLARSRLGWREQLAFKSGGLPVRALSLNI
jgi:23S rRNA G2445 N2-methylase RlmL